MKYHNLISIIEEIAPPHLSESWDNSGVQINTGKEEISSVLVSLEMNSDVIKEAVKTGADMIITHHPLIFGSIDSIDAADMQTGKYIRDLIAADISVYSAHLSFDNAPLGNNYYLGRLLKLNRALKPAGEAENSPGIVGELSGEMTLDEMCGYVVKVLDLPEHYLRVVGNLNSTVRKVGLCTGAGGDFLDTALRNGCDVMITGDVKFHEAQWARARGLAVIDAGHYGTEKIFAENFAAQLSSRTQSGLIVKETSANTNPFVL